MSNSFTERGRCFLKNIEGLRLHWYFDSCGKPTIGYGHLIKPEEMKLYTQLKPAITPAEAQALFDSDIERHVTNLNDLIKVKLNFSQFDALCVFEYNIGYNAFRGSTLLLDLNASKFDLIPHEMLRWVHDDHGNIIQGLVNRQTKTANLFKSPL